MLGEGEGGGAVWRVHSLHCLGVIIHCYFNGKMGQEKGERGRREEKKDRTGKYMLV